MTAQAILIATGSQAWIPQFPGNQYAVTSDGFFDLQTLPKKVAIVGAGYIAVEFAGIDLVLSMFYLIRCAAIIRLSSLAIP